MFSTRVFTTARPIITRAWSAQTKRLAHKTNVVQRELPRPQTKSRVPWYIGGAVVGGLVWIVGLGGALNYQRLSSSVVAGTLFMVRYDPRIIDMLGDKIDYADKWPWITGTVNHFKGQVSIAFDVAGQNGERGRVRFSSFRRGNEWRTVEFVVIRESDGKSVDLGNELELTETGAPSTSVAL
ncbi:cytochrome oxidase complex assembly protein 1-domain-containing protein [Zychaea mexicana]|uniref:cytochrome oxidase complex assembly protein 1-domain-containing protein n=1 Tax=Zychaea mexicana TaxID=64656 RepID=UPI0022FECDBA|nr:cytochrome oxidase complex assembly protein 1-domain-containing protein [Zychaea mexicana]KAI9493721.1 cytochrome oxidase complex assembly protein 1-domain-containing protein [Zychaea mexicana]